MTIEFNKPTNEAQHRERIQTQSSIARNLKGNLDGAKVKLAEFKKEFKKFQKNGGDTNAEQNKQSPGGREVVEPGQSDGQEAKP